ncbi:glutaredoxin [Anaerosporobacter faecicola]|uniref:glutaredoxin n=1 Tax=Anaerosporobacter faecicola TaxID=2718714 RepID=UPI00143AF91A|nr:glutaredoxin [Anaerosporobacter faecicola]
MKVIMYGAPICGECVAAKERLLACNEVELEYRNIVESTTIMKEFLSIRDHDILFQEIKEQGKIGIPFFLLEDGTKTFTIEDYVSLAAPKPVKSACSLNGKGSC